MASNPIRTADSSTVAEFRKYLDEGEARCKARIARADAEEKAEKEKGNELSLGAYLSRQKAYEQLRDFEVARGILEQYDLYKS